jgi:Tol biopolymer transport system component
LYSDTAILLWTLLDGVIGVPRRGSLVPGGWSPAGNAVVGVVGEERSFNAGSSSAPGWHFWLERLPIDGTSAQRLWLLSGWFDAGEVAAPAWSPDGSLIAFGATPGRIWLIDASNGASRWWARELTSGFAPTFVPPGVRLTR